MARSRPDEPVPDGEALLAGRYTVGEPIGRGRSTVHRGEDRRLLRRVAIKEVRLAGGQEDADRVRRRAMREAHAAARLNDPHVVTVYDVVEEGGSIWLVMELVDAPSLAKIVADEGAMSHRRAARIGLGVLSALDTAHAVGVVHRDVKPANVLVGEDDRTKLADFGVASIRDESQLTAIGSIIGSPAYMAPEQAMAAKVGPPADLWALGATLYFAVEGKPPFAGDSALATATAVVTGQPRPQQSVGPLSSLIDRLLAKEPGRRPNAGHVRAVLTAAAATGKPRSAKTRSWTAPTLRSRAVGRSRTPAEPAAAGIPAPVPIPPPPAAEAAPTLPTVDGSQVPAEPAPSSTDGAPDVAEPADVAAGTPAAAEHDDSAPVTALDQDVARSASDDPPDSPAADKSDTSAETSQVQPSPAVSSDVGGLDESAGGSDDQGSPVVGSAVGDLDESAEMPDDQASSAVGSDAGGLDEVVEGTADRGSSAVGTDAGLREDAEDQGAPAVGEADGAAEDVEDERSSVAGSDGGGLHESAGGAGDRESSAVGFDAGEGGEAAEGQGSSVVGLGAGGLGEAAEDRRGSGAEEAARAAPTAGYQPGRVVVPAPDDDEEPLAAGLAAGPLIDLDGAGRRGAGLAALRSAFSGEGQRRVVIAVVAVIALVVAGLGVRTILADDDEPAATRGTQGNGAAADDAAEETPSSSTPGSTEASPDASPETTAATTPAPAPPTDGEVPADWVRYQDSSAGYIIAHPPGWQVEPAGGPRVDIRDPSTGSYLRIDWTDTPRPDPVADWRTQASGFAQRHQGYQEIQIAPYTYRDYNAGMWEFRYQDGGVQLHAANLGFVTNNRGYALFFQTHEDRWAQSQDIYAAFQASFQPAP